MKTPEDIFRAGGGQLRMSDAIRSGITRHTLYALKEKGVLEQVSRGIYRLAELPSLADPDLTTVALRCPNAVICLVSALAFHGLTTQVPHRVSVAVPRESRPPVLDYPPLQVYRFSSEAYRAGIEEHRIDSIPVKIYTPAKTIADCFKFRNKIGMDVVLEGLKRYRTGKRNLNELIPFAKVCRVEAVMRPYLEASL